MREARPGDAKRLSRMRYEFRATEDTAVDWCRQEGIGSVIL